MKSFDIKNILVPLDFSETSMEALKHAVFVAKLNGASITLLKVVEGMQPFIIPVDYPVSFSYNLTLHERTMVKESKKHFAKLVDSIKKKDKVSITSITSKGWVKAEIVEASKRIKADMIIMGTHGVKGFREFIIGSNTFRVINETQCPVLSIQKHTDKLGFKNILVPFRDKAHSREKVDYAIKMAKIYGARIHVLGIETDNDETQFKKLVKEAEQIKKITEKNGLVCTIEVKTSKYLVEEVLKYAETKEIDLIVVMSDLDRMRISEYFMGPFCQQMVNHSTIPVLSIQPTFNPDTIVLYGYGW